MTPRIAVQPGKRARRFPLHLPVYFRQIDSPKWLEGVTENISYTGVLFLSSARLAPETPLELRLQVGMSAASEVPTEIRCKGTVVRSEQIISPETPIGLGVAIKDYRIVSHHSLGGGPVGNA